MGAQVERYSTELIAEKLQVQCLATFSELTVYNLLGVGVAYSTSPVL